MKKYILDRVTVHGDSGALMVKLQNEGWKDLQYVANNSWGDCRPPDIMGNRPMTEKELKERQKAIKAHNKEEVKEMLRLAKKHKYKATKE